MNSPRETPAAVQLAAGRIFVSGGLHDRDLVTVATSEIYDPATGMWTETAPMAEARQKHVATLLADGRGLITGGGRPDGPYIKSAEISDPVTDAWSSAGDMALGRTLHTAVLLDDGRVLVIGGKGERTMYVPTEIVTMFGDDADLCDDNVVFRDVNCDEIHWQPPSANDDDEEGDEYGYGDY